MCIRDRYYTQDDLKNYIQILFDTESIYKNNDQNTCKPKSSKGNKHMNLIADIWRNRNNVEGSGMKQYKEYVEYAYIDNLNELLGRRKDVYKRQIL